MLGIIPSLAVTLFVGIGSIVANNAKELPNQKLPLRTDGCYVNESTSVLSSTLPLRFSISDNDGWKDQEYSTLTNIFAISYLWHPLITVVSSVIFGFLFSVIVNMKRKQRRVKSHYLTPLVLKLWVKILGREYMERWVEFEDKDSSLDKNNGTTSMTIPRITVPPKVT